MTTVKESLPPPFFLYFSILDQPESTSSLVMMTIRFLCVCICVFACGGAWLLGYAFPLFLPAWIVVYPQKHQKYNDRNVDLCIYI